MPGGRARDAAGLLERMQDATPEGQTFSAGVCECDVDGNLANVLDRADMALYEAKQAGRQRIRTAGDPLP